MASPAPCAPTIWIVAPSMHAPLLPITITNSSAEPVVGGGGAGGAGASGEVGAVGMRGKRRPPSLEHPARTTTVTRMATPNFMAKPPDAPNRGQSIASMVGVVDHSVERQN